MNETRLLTEEDYPLVYDLIYSHNIIAGLTVERPAFEVFVNKISKDDRLFGHFKDGELTAFLGTKLLKSLPSWYFSMLSSKRKQDYFDIRKTGIVEVVDTAIEYWESQGIFSMFTIQSLKHRRVLTDQLKKYSPGRFSQYQVPAPTVEVIKAGTLSNSLLIRSMCQDNIFDEDKIVKWIFRKDYLHETPPCTQP